MMERIQGEEFAKSLLSLPLIPRLPPDDGKGPPPRHAVAVEIDSHAGVPCGFGGLPFANHDLRELGIRRRAVGHRPGCPSEGISGVGGPGVGGLGVGGTAKGPQDGAGQEIRFGVVGVELPGAVHPIQSHPIRAAPVCKLRQP